MFLVSKTSKKQPLVVNARQAKYEVLTLSYTNID